MVALFLQTAYIIFPGTDRDLSPPEQAKQGDFQVKNCFMSSLPTLRSTSYTKTQHHCQRSIPDTETHMNDLADKKNIINNNE